MAADSAKVSDVFIANFLPPFRFSIDFIQIFFPFFRRSSAGGGGGFCGSLFGLCNLLSWCDFFDQEQIFFFLLRLKLDFSNSDFFDLYKLEPHP